MHSEQSYEMSVLATYSDQVWPPLKVVETNVPEDKMFRTICIGISIFIFFLYRHQTLADINYIILKQH